RLLEIGDERLHVVLSESDPVDHVADVQPDVVERVVQLVGDARGQLAQRCELACLNELLLFVAKLVLSALHLLRGLTQVAHDVDHRLAAVAEPEVGLVRVLEDVEQRAPRVVEALGLSCQTAAVLLVVAENMQHRLPLVRELLVRLIEVAHDVDERAPALLGALDVSPQLLDLLAQFVRVEFRPAVAGLPGVKPPGFFAHHAEARAALSFSFSRWRPSSSFSRAIIFSSRPTTTSSNFSRSRIFSCRSVFDRSRSRTTSS